MGRGIALIVGVPQPGPQSGWRADRLPGVAHDVVAMKRLARDRGFESPVVLERQDATAGNVLNAVDEAARLLQAGDMFLFTYSGHGAQRTDSNDHDEPRDQLLLTYDRALVDDELGRRWSAFRSGVRILVTTDSCHSGSSVRSALELALEADRTARSAPAAPPPVLSIGIPTDGYRSRAGNIEGLRASLIHLAASKDAQEALDIGSNGLFTSCLLRSLHAHPRSNYRQLLDSIRQLMRRTVHPGEQQCQMTVYGEYQSSFTSQVAFAPQASWPPQSVFGGNLFG